ncbi:hypothetical protein FACS189467_0640 [Bacteroidia bacterium]|nr:hypothetical protein FACS189467_0640 [Bacteroidia bacterium]
MDEIHKIYTLEELTDKHIGVKGTARRDAFENELMTPNREVARQNLDRCTELAERYGLSAMTMNEITNEVKTVRQNAKVVTQK